MTTEILNNIIVSYPGEYRLEQFDNAVSPLFQTISHNLKVNNNLKTMRNSLMKQMLDNYHDDIK